MIVTSERMNREIETYEESARVIHLWLEEFCDTKKIFPAMIADASRKAGNEIKYLRNKIDKIQRERDELDADLKSILQNSTRQLGVIKHKEAGLIIARQALKDVKEVMVKINYLSSAREIDLYLSAMDAAENGT